MLKRPHVFVVGYPGDVGGANTECWHTVRLWRRFGLNVTFIPTWTPNAQFQARLDRIGCPTIHTNADNLHAVSGLRDAVVVSFCNSKFLKAAGQFRKLGCRIVWVNCMTWLFPEERRHYYKHGLFDKYVFQSRYQRDELQPQLTRFEAVSGRFHRIRGAFFLDEFEFRPLMHTAGTGFVVGRISRADRDKFAVNTWDVYQRIPHVVKARVMAWSRRIERKLGPPPAWCECLAMGAETVQQFFGKIHCMIQANGGAQENWPRSGLEAMACGVPIVAENKWGWREMIRHAETGYLADNDDEMVRLAAKLACDEDLRIDMAIEARNSVERELADPRVLWGKWKELFGELGVG